MFSLHTRFRAIVRKPEKEHDADQNSLTLFRDATAGTPSPSRSSTLIDTNSRYAHTGYDLLQMALSELQEGCSRDEKFQRQLYIDSVAYLLRGLPPDLSHAEVETVRNALPQGISSSLGIETPRLLPPKKTDPSLLHRGLASMVILLCLLVRLSAPYIKHLFINAWRYERTHHISERLLASGISTADTVGRKTMEIATIAMGHETVTSCVAYCVDGISGGLTEGLGEGLKVIEAPLSSHN